MSCVLMCANTISHITKERKHIHYSYMLVDPLLIDYIPIQKLCESIYLGNSERYQYPYNSFDDPLFFFFPIISPTLLATLTYQIVVAHQIHPKPLIA